MKKWTNSIFARAFFALAIFLFPVYAQAATLYIAPAIKNVVVGQTFTLSAYVSSPDQAMNAASGDISFPTDKLQVLSISKANSIMSLWIRDPSFNNSVEGGDVNFQGIVLNPGFTGAAGNLITVNFQAVGQGTASVSYSSGAVLANDGNGTNILNGMTGATVTIGPRPAAPVAPAQPTVPTSTATSTPVIATTTIVIASTTMPPPVVVGYIPSSNKWKNLAMLITEWGLLVLLGLSLLAAIVFLALNIVHRIRKWRVSSGRDLLALEETLRNDLKRIEKELGAEKRGKNDPERKAIERVESEIKKDIDAIDDLKK